MIIFSASISLYVYLMGFQKQAEALTWGIPFATLFLALGVFLALSRETLRRQMKEAEVADQQKQSELELLRSQLSPHFLFNTLNNLYGLSITQQDKIPFLIVKLSDLLRYSVYDTKQTFVPLNKELAYIHNYIELEKIRMGDRLLLKMDVSDSEEAIISIPPMLLIVFIENAFKHSKNSYNEIIKINISLKVNETGIIFNIDNTCGEATGSNPYLEKESGVGLSNAIRRLELLYPGKHSLIHYKENDLYHVVLKLNV
jgi:LytS/YehU family sensor histidine kinase